MTGRLAGFGLVVSCVALLSTGVHHAQQPAAKVDYARDVQPILRQQCYSCHGPREQKNGLRLDRRKDAMRGGTIAVIGPGNADGSRLYQRLIGHDFGTQMPPTGSLPASQVAVIRQWIDQGAEWPDALAGEVPAAPADPAASALIEAIRANERPRIAAALEHADVLKAAGPGGATPLMYAALYGDTGMVRAMLDGGANPSAQDESGATALMWAVPDIEKVRLLLDRGADVTARSADGRTALMIAAGLPAAEPVARLLIERGAKVKDRGPSLFGDVTPLVLAAYNGDEAMFRLLVDKGADLDADAVPALAFALRAGCKSCVETLLPRLPAPALSAAMFITAPPTGPALATPLFLANGADPNAKDPHGATILMLAAASDAIPADAVRSLIERGADVNATGPGGITALRLARLRGKTAVTDLLEKAGAKDETAPMPAPSFTPAPSTREAVARALPLLQRADKSFMAKSGCVSCHNNTLTAMTVTAARASGIPVDEQTAREQSAAIGAYIRTWRDRAIQGIGIPGDADTVSYILLGMAAAQYPADAATDALARFLKGQQRADGHWDLLAHRPPIESTEVQVTAMTMRALQLYAPAAHRAAYEAAARRAGEWIAKAEPRTTEDWTFKLLGLHWAGASAERITAAARGLVAQQRSDGGWAQIPSLGSDAYATGQALFALVESGAIPPTDAAWRRGADFLRTTQLADGSWFVKSRALPIQPHFEAGFPHGKDQFISAAATNWAALALAKAK